MYRQEAILPDVPYQHVVFTIPELLWTLIQANRIVGLNILFAAAKDTLLEYCRARGFIPCVMSVSHTFGRDLKFNSHIHVLISSGGLSLNHQKWIDQNYLHHAPIKILWRAKVLAGIRAAIQAKLILILPRNIGGILELSYSKYKNWYVHIGKKLKGAKKAARYIGRYTKRPAIATSRIVQFKNNEVTFWFEDHHSKKRITWTLPALDFIARVIIHIPDHYFRKIRYSGCLASRVKKKLVGIIRHLFDHPPLHLSAPVNWRKRIEMFTGRDPLTCRCGLDMLKSRVCLPKAGAVLVPI